MYRCCVDKNKRRRRFASAIVALAAAMTGAETLMADAEDPATVLILVNDATPAEPGTGVLGASQFVGQYYAQARKIPARNIVHINTQVTADPHRAQAWTISWTDFDSQIRRPVGNFLEHEGLKYQIKYIVTTYGVPSHLLSSGGNETFSVDSFLASMFSPGSNERALRNPAAMSGKRQVRAGLSWPVYAVTRLDGPSPELAVRLVERALEGERGMARQSGAGYFDFRGVSDTDPARYADGSVSDAARRCRDAGFDCRLHSRQELGTAISSAPNALWVWGWPGAPADDGYTFAPGAVGALLAPESAATLRDASASVARWIERGITATWGATSDPDFKLYAAGDRLLESLWQGSTFGEAAYRATPVLNWKMVFLGDPLYKPAFTDSCQLPCGRNNLPELRVSIRERLAPIRDRGEERITPIGGFVTSGDIALSLASGTATAGGTVALSLNLTSNGGALPTAIQWSFDTSASVSGVTVAVGSSSTSANKAVSCNRGSCLIYGLNSTTIGNGTIAVATFQIAASTPAGTLTIPISGVMASSALGDSIPSNATPGGVTVNVSAQPTADSVTPSSGTGFGQTFTFVFSDAVNADSFTGIGLLINSSLNVINGCFLVYDRLANRIALLWDGATGSDSKPVNAQVVLQNSSCSLGAFTAAVSGPTLTITAALSFKPMFAGPKNIYMFGSEASVNTGWVARGTYTVLQPAPTADSVTPSAGSGFRQGFTFMASDARGASYLTGIAMLFSSSLSPANACQLIYDRTVNRISLSYDNPSNGATPVQPGSSAIVSNSQCTLRAAGSSVTAGTNSLVISVDLEFSAGFSGAKNTYMYVAAVGANSGWVTLGTWQVSNGLPTADSVSPSSGSGSSQTFAFTVTDPGSQTAITGIAMQFTAGTAGIPANSCSLMFDRYAGTIGLYSDDGSSLPAKGLGSSATLQNSQRAVGYTVMTTSGNSVTFSIFVLFKPAFTGSKTVYLKAINGAGDSGWVSKGAWAVP
jgi:uncharacterized protein (TIGR03790 family)